MALPHSHWRVIIILNLAYYGRLKELAHAVIRTMLNGKIHRATVTAADLHYIGSTTIDSVLLEAADIRPYEKVHVVDINNGARLETYAIPGEPGSGTIQMNGAAARLVAVGDLVIIMSYVQIEEPGHPTSSWWTIGIASLRPAKSALKLFSSTPI